MVETGTVLAIQANTDFDFSAIRVLRKIHDELGIDGARGSGEQELTPEARSRERTNPH